ncbi:MAG: hypothetical protein ACI9XO_000152 [Paraglaciecola sp.]|jgi:hypothetical protein
MKQIILFFFISFLSLAIQAHNGLFGSDSPNPIGPTISIFEDNHSKISIFPNPTTEFISVANDKNVKQITIFNLVGRKIKIFEAKSGERYNVSGLPNGMYLVQLRDHNLKVITTQRISKR